MEEKQQFSKKCSIYEKWSEPGNEYTSVRRHPGDRNGYFNNSILSIIIYIRYFELI